jgi:hypothetical protein
MTVDKSILSAKGGFVSSITLIIIYSLTFIYYVIMGEKAQIVLIVILVIAPILEICIFLSLRRLIVIDFDLVKFNIPIILLILFQIIIPTMILIIKYQVLSPKILVIPFIVFGIISIGIYLWYLILISKTEKTELPGIHFLQYFGITFLLAFIVNGVLSANAEMNKMAQDTYQLTDLLYDIIPNVFLLLFFIHTLRRIKKQNNIPNT